MRILVTGAAGFIGSHLSEALMSEGHCVLGVDCFRDHYEVQRRLDNLAILASNPLFEFSESDLVTTDLCQLLDNVDAVIHLAGRSGVRSSWGGPFAQYLDDNMLVTHRLAEAMCQAGIRRIVFASSSSVYGELGDRASAAVGDDCRPRSPYGVTKLAAERLLLAYQDAGDLDVVALRYFTIYGPRQRSDMAIERFIEAALQNRPVVVYGDGKQTRDVTYVSDCVHATVSGLDLSPGVFNVAGGNVVSINEILDNIEHATGRPIQCRYEPQARGDVRSTVADTSGLAALGVFPKVMIDEGIQAQAAEVARRLAAAAAAAQPE